MAAPCSLLTAHGRALLTAHCAWTRPALTRPPFLLPRPRAQAPRAPPTVTVLRAVLADVRARRVTHHTPPRTMVAPTAGAPRRQNSLGRINKLPGVMAGAPPAAAAAASAGEPAAGTGVLRRSAITPMMCMPFLDDLSPNLVEEKVHIGAPPRARGRAGQRGGGGGSGRQPATLGLLACLGPTDEIGDSYQMWERTNELA